jgi:hypothetical protein
MRTAYRTPVERFGSRTRCRRSGSVHCRGQSANRSQTGGPSSQRCDRECTRHDVAGMPASFAQGSAPLRIATSEAVPGAARIRICLDHDATVVFIAVSDRRTRSQ